MDPATPRTYALLGDPVDHSLSPQMHNAAMGAAGIDGRYVALAVDAQGCGPLLRELALSGGGGNVTVPHKVRVLPFLDRTTDAVRATGACNTFWSEAGEVWGDNTDVTGFLGTWTAASGGETEEGDALVLGAGGAARAVVHAILQTGTPRVHVWNRTPARARELVADLADARIALCNSPEGLTPNVVVNATSVGISGAGTPIDLRALDRLPTLVIDLVYGDAPTELLVQANALGARTVDGLDMLVRQAEAAYERWFRVVPPPGVMRAALSRG